MREEGGNAPKRELSANNGGKASMSKKMEEMFPNKGWRKIF